ncbi:hypothetical protein HHI36_010770 [Cryptolaemus montrouzieri]|uniref:WKF domain-containing protein n=1 Tax=Cryptolaemus montrouzieri TaxID=559131 RepID=A0ABD2MKF8_9CUCU
MSLVEEKKISKKNRQRGRNKRIGFSNEIVTKEAAKLLLSDEINSLNETTSKSILARLNGNQEVEATTKKREKKNKHIDNCPDEENVKVKITKKKKDGRNLSSNISDDLQEVETPNSKPKKRKRTEETESKGSEVDKSSSTDKKDEDKPLSKRAIKKIKHEKLLNEKRMKVDMGLQQKALTYLSKWKYDRTNWKFEKLTQIWLLHNLYDSSKIEDNIWDIVVEYFSNSKGQIHKTILQEAIKIAENDQSINDIEKIKLVRARDLIQTLQE